MVTDPAYAPPLIETARANIRRVVDAFSAETGLSRTFLSEVARSDRAFMTRLDEHAFSFKVYEEVMGRLSAAWPDDAEWPHEVPRAAPVEIPEVIRSELDTRLARREETRAARIAELKAELARLGAHAGGEQASALT